MWDCKENLLLVCLFIYAVTQGKVIKTMSHIFLSDFPDKFCL
jgi:hypothetical protein